MKKIASASAIIMSALVAGCTPTDQSSTTPQKANIPFSPETFLSQYQNARIVELEATEEWKTVRNFWELLQTLPENQLGKSLDMDESYNSALADSIEALLTLAEQKKISDFESEFIRSWLSDVFYAKRWEDESRMTRMVMPASYFLEPGLLESLQTRVDLLLELQESNIINETEFAQAFENMMKATQDYVSVKMIYDENYFFYFEETEIVEIAPESSNSEIEPAPGKFFEDIKLRLESIDLEEIKARYTNFEEDRDLSFIDKSYTDAMKNLKKIESEWPELEKLIVSLIK